jgi:lactoylglutathione lyase
MKIEHVAVWAKDIERLRAFYEKYFGAVSGDKYVNRSKQFESYFLNFSSGARLELMQMPNIPESLNSTEVQFIGYIHIAISTGSNERVDNLTAQLRADGYKVVDGPRQTGDDYYESVVLDPEGNRVEVTV